MYAEEADTIVADLGGGAQGKVEISAFAYNLKLFRERKRVADLICGNDQELDLHFTVAQLLLPHHYPHDANTPMVIPSDMDTLRRQLAPLVDLVSARVANLANFKSFQPGTADIEEASGSAAPSPSANKFAMAGQKITKAQFGSQMLFRRGLEALIGLPSLSVRAAMEDEHKSEEEFRSGNYGTKTCPKLEWEFVTAPKEGAVYPGEKTVDDSHGRERKLLADLMQQEDCVKSKLTEDELIAIRLYTGPMYMAYNQVTRDALQQYMTAELADILEHWTGQPCRHAQDKAACAECRAALRRCALVSDEELVEYAIRYFGMHADCTAQESATYLEGVLAERGRLTTFMASSVRTIVERWEKEADKPAHEQDARERELKDCARRFGVEVAVGGRELKAVADKLKELAESGGRKMAMTFRFVTTIHMVSSAIIKLSGQTPMPEGRTVYRGLTGVELPMCFFIATMQGCRAGVEGAFMSCSTRKDVAMQYAGKGERPIIFEMSVGEIDIGADVRNLSQYPNENEVVFPPLSNIEIEGQPRIEESTGGKREVLVMKARINVNLKSLTREELEARRYDVVMNSLHNTKLEVERDLASQVENIRVESKNGFDKGRANGWKIRELIVNEVADVVAHYASTDTSQYNEDYAYQLALQDATNLPRVAMGKFKYWLETPGVFPINFHSMSMWKVDSMKMGQAWARYLKEKEEQAKQAGVALPSGLRWLKAEAGTASPHGRNELHHPGLAKALGSGSRREFTPEEWAALGVGDLHKDVFVRAGGACFVPADVRALAMKLVQMEALVRVHDGEKMGFDDLEGVEGNTALIRAAARGDCARVQLLLDAGCNIQVSEGSAQTFSALHAAACNNYVDVVRILIQHRADLEARNGRDETPLITACRNGNTPCVAALIEAGADIMARMKTNGASGLCLACQNGHLEVVKVMCQAGGEALVLQPDKNNVSPLVSAVRYKHTHIVRFMVELSAKQLLLLENGTGRSCLHWAVTDGNQEIEAILRLHGGDQLCQLLNGDGRTADDVKAAHSK